MSPFFLINLNFFSEISLNLPQQIERQLLLAEKSYKPKFDLKDLIYIEYDQNNLKQSIKAYFPRVKNVIFADLLWG